jgi:hypothetical protein
MELDELTNCSPEDAARFQVLIDGLSLDEASEIAFRKRVDWLLSDEGRRQHLAQKAALEWLAYVLAVYQAGSGRKFARLPRVFDLPVFDSMRAPIHQGLIGNHPDFDDDEDFDEEDDD